MRSLISGATANSSAMKLMADVGAEEAKPLKNDISMDP